MGTGRERERAAARAARHVHACCLLHGRGAQMLLHLHVRAQSPPHVRYVYSTIVVESGRQHRACSDEILSLSRPPSCTTSTRAGQACAATATGTGRSLDREAVVSCPPDARSKAKEGKGPHPQHCCSTWFSPRFALARCRSHGPRAAFPGSPGWRGGCLPCLLPWPGRSSRQPMMRDWCWEIVHGSRCRVIACCLRCAAFSWLVGNGQGGGVRPGESRAQAPREPARRILFLPCMQGNKTDTARSRSGDSSALPPC